MNRNLWLPAALLLAGCTSPRDLPQLGSKLNRIDSVSLDTLSETKPISISESTTNTIRKLEADEPAAEIRLTLEDVRIAVLKDNLQLQADLIEPAVAQAALDAERAKFEVAFYGVASWQRWDPVDADDQSRTRQITAGLRKPLPTGGTLSAELSLDTIDSASPTNQAAAEIRFTQPLLRGAGFAHNTRSIRVARLQGQIVSARTKLRMIHLLAAADAAYWNLYTAIREQEVRREQYQLAQDQLDHARKKVASGAAARIETVRAEAGVASRLEAVINAENRVEQRQRSLLQIMGVRDLHIDSLQHIIPTTVPAPQGFTLDRRKLIDLALANRMDVIQIDLQLAISDLEIRSTRNNLLPDLSVTGSYNLGNGNADRFGAVSGLNDNPSENAYVGLALNIPLGNRAARAQLERARLSRTIAEIDKTELKQIIEQQVLNAVNDLETNWRRILAAEQGVQAAERDYRVEQSQFQLGVRTSTDVLQAATRLSDAQLARIRAFTDYEISRVSLARSTGTLLGHSGIHIEDIPQKSSIHLAFE